MSDISSYVKSRRNRDDAPRPGIHCAAFWSAAIFLGTTVLSFLLPLDVPGGYEATTPERVAWLSANTGLFIVGWINLSNFETGINEENEYG